MKCQIFFFLALLTVAPQLMAQDLPPCGPTDTTGKLFIIDAATGTSVSTTDYRLRDTVRVVVINENRLVNNYKLSTEAKEISEQLSFFLGAFPFAQAITGSGAGAQTAAPPAAGAASELTARMAPQKAEEVSAGPDCSEELERNRQTAANLEEAAKALREKDIDLRRQIKGLTDQYATVVGEIKPSQTTMSSPSIACPHLRQTIESFLKRVSEVEKELATGEIKKSLRDQERAVAAQEVRLQDFKRGFSGDCISKVLDWIDRYQEQLKVAQGNLEKFSADVAEVEKGRDAIVMQRGTVRDAVAHPNVFYEERPVGPFRLPNDVTVKLEVTPNAKGSTPIAQGPWTLNFGGGPRFAVSAGIAYASLEDQTFKIVTSSEVQPATGTTPATPIKKVALDKDADSRTTPLVLIHTRLPFFERSFVNFHASFGLSAKIQDNSTKAEYLAGLSVSLAEERFFLTVGGYYGGVQKLEGGFSVGSTIPSGVTELPVRTEKHWKPGFAFSYRLR